MGGNKQAEGVKYLLSVDREGGDFCLHLLTVLFGKEQ